MIKMPLVLYGKYACSKKRTTKPCKFALLHKIIAQTSGARSSQNVNTGCCTHDRNTGIRTHCLVTGDSRPHGTDWHGTDSELNHEGAPSSCGWSSGPSCVAAAAAAADEERQRQVHSTHASHTPLA